MRQEILKAVPIISLVGSEALKMLGGQKTSTAEADEKGDLDVGHHAIVTPTDVWAQSKLIDLLVSHTGPVRFLTEEKADSRTRGTVIQSAEEMFRYTTKTWIVDPVDGSSSHAVGHHEFSHSLGLYIDRVHVGGVIFAPAILGGLLVYGDRESVCVAEGKRWRDATEARRLPQEKPLKSSYVITGPDLPIFDQFGKFLPAFSKAVRTTNCTGSCALGMALVAAGKADAIIQPVQGPWDWAAGYPLIETVGGKVQFYHYRKGVPVPMDEPDQLSYDPTRRQAAFIAGIPSVVDHLFNLLQETWVEQ